MLQDITMDALQVAMRGLAARQRATADNVANIETPGYLAQRVDFESSLRNALDNGSVDPTSTDAAPTTARSLEPTRMNGNNVNLDEETVSDVDTQLRYQLVVEALNNKYTMLRNAIRGDA